MKKIIYILAVTGLITIVACSDGDKLPSVNYSGCQTCEVAGVSPDSSPEDYEICTGLHTYQLDTTPFPDTIDNPVELSYETVYVDGADTNLAAAEYFTLFCDNAYNPDANNPNPPGTPTTTCVTCAESDMLPAPVNICKGTNGNAFVGNADQQIPYEQYIDAFETASHTTCE